MFRLVRSRHDADHWLSVVGLEITPFNQPTQFILVPDGHMINVSVPIPRDPNAFMQAEFTGWEPKFVQAYRPARTDDGGWYQVFSFKMDEIAILHIPWDEQTFACATREQFIEAQETRAAMVNVPQKVRIPPDHNAGQNTG